MKPFSVSVIGSLGLVQKKVTGEWTRVTKKRDWNHRPFIPADDGPITQKAIYKWYILPIGGLYATYYLLREPENNQWLIGPFLFKLSWSTVCGVWAGPKISLYRSVFYTYTVYSIVIRVVVSNIFHFHPYLGKIPILTNIFQMGWNHQPVILVLPMIYRLSLRQQKDICGYLWSRNQGRGLLFSVDLPSKTWQQTK